MAQRWVFCFCLHLFIYHMECKKRVKITLGVTLENDKPSIDFEGKLLALQNIIKRCPLFVDTEEVSLDIRGIRLNNSQVLSVDNLSSTISDDGSTFFNNTIAFNLTSN